tara:strand:- start:94 stop:873 length:780 start_codon:yes stop_codon:yes gene_type:complete
MMAAVKPNTMEIQIYAIGGSEFTHEDTAPGRDVMLEDRLLALAPKMPKIGYIGHASDDDPDRLKSFYNKFSSRAQTSHLPLDASASTAWNFAAGLDILYVSGGSTKQMLNHWKATGFDDVFKEAGRRGVILAGVSAGAICWFTDLLLGTSDQGFELLPGLGLVRGSACPHYDSEPKRRDAYDSAIAAGRLAPGLAIDDGVAVHIVAGRVCQIVKAREGQAAFVRADQDGKTVRATLKTGFYLESDALTETTFERVDRAY